MQNIGSVVEVEEMIRKLTVTGVTIFPQETSFDFVPGINVIVGGNDSGKSHLMRLCYALCRWCEKSLRREFPEIWAEEERLRRHLLRAFNTQELGSLVSRSLSLPHSVVRASFSGSKAPLGSAELAFEIRSDDEQDSIGITSMPQRFLQERALFIPSREVLTLYPCYVQVGKRYPDLLDGASWDLCRALEAEPTREGIESAPLRRVRRLVEALLQGELSRGNGSRFMLHRGKEKPMELSLVAEGFKRPGTLALLLSNGSLRPGDTLIWDEPEMNLNAAHLPLLCGMMLGLCEAGLQVILSTHSLFLLRELVIQLNRSDTANVPRRFFGFHASPDPLLGVQVSSGESPDDIEPPESLEAEMEQADRYLRMPRHKAHVH